MMDEGRLSLNATLQGLAEVLVDRENSTRKICQRHEI